MKRPLEIALLVAALLVISGTLTAQDRGGSQRPASAPTTSPTTRPLSSLLQGTYYGTVMDDDQVVPCRTKFNVYRGKISGQYTVREGRKAYTGTLDRYQLVDPDRLICCFQWHDKHGTGLLTVQVTPDGSSFAGSWGKEIVQEELIWTGRRERDDR